jgi:hypothetical protein
MGSAWDWTKEHAGSLLLSSHGISPWSPHADKFIKDNKIISGPDRTPYQKQGEVSEAERDLALNRNDPSEILRKARIAAVMAKSARQGRQQFFAPKPALVKPPSSSPASQDTPLAISASTKGLLGQ